MTGGDGYTPHPGDPWHPDWDPERASRDDEFVPEREVREPRARRRGLFRRRHDEEEPEFAPEAPFEEPPPIELVGDQPAGSVDDVYEPLRAEAPPVEAPPTPAPVATAETATVASDADIEWGEFTAGVDLAAAAARATAPPPAPISEAVPVVAEPAPAADPEMPAVEVDAERLAAEEAARVEAERLAAEEAARVEADEAEETDQAEAAPGVEPVPAPDAEAERLAAEEAARVEAERLAAEEAEEAARVEAERLAAEEAARVEAERLAAEEAARVEAERLAAEEAERAARVEAERLAAEEAARVEAERLAAEEAERLAREEAERAAAAEAERLAEEAASRAAADEAAAAASEPDLVELEAQPEPADAEPEPERADMEPALAQPDGIETTLEQPEVTTSEGDVADAEAERLAEEAWRRAEAEFGVPATIDDEVDLETWRDFATTDDVAVEAAAEAEPEPAAPRRRWWRRREEPAAVAGADARLEPIEVEEAPAGAVVDDEEAAWLEAAEPAVDEDAAPVEEPAGEPAESSVLEPIVDEEEEALAEMEVTEPSVGEPLALEPEAAEPEQAAPPQRSWWRRALGLPPPAPATEVGEPAGDATLAEEPKPVAVFPPSPVDEEPAAPVDGAGWGEAPQPMELEEEAEPAPFGLEEVGEPHIEAEVLEEELEPALAELGDEREPVPLEEADVEAPLSFQEAWIEERAPDEEWGDAAEPAAAAGLEAVADPLAIEPLAEEDEEPAVDEAEAPKRGRAVRWWRRMFALDAPDELAEDGVVADPALVADEPAADDLLAGEPSEDPLATAWAEEPMPVVDFPETGEEAAEPAIAPGPDAGSAEVDAWLAFTDDEPAEAPDPGASWPALGDERPAAAAAVGLLADVPSLPEWAEPAAEPSTGEAAGPEEAAPEEAVAEEPLPVGVAAFELTHGDDDEFRLEEISEEHYYLQATTQEHLGLAESVAAAAEEQGELQAVAAAIPGVESGVVGFDDVAQSAYPSEDEEDEEVAVAAARRGSELTLRVVTGLLLVALFVGTLWWSATALSVLVVVVVLVALGEFYAVVIRQRYQPLTLFGLVGGAVALLGARVWGTISVPGALMLTATLVFFYYAMSPHRRAPLLNGAVTITGVAWVTGFAAFFMPMLDSDDYKVLVFAVVMITVFADVGSYFTGRSRGRRKLAPVVSPGKTVEGLIGGAIAAVGIGAAIGQLDPLTTTDGIILGATIAAVAPIGDLSVSMLKRSLGIKNMSGILPGHGGLLDRVDGLLFAVPAAWLAFVWLGLLG